MSSHAAYMAGETSFLRFVEERTDLANLAEYRALAEALSQLDRSGNYSPDEDMTGELQFA